MAYARAKAERTRARQIKVHRGRTRKARWDGAGIRQRDGKGSIPPHNIHTCGTPHRADCNVFITTPVPVPTSAPVPFPEPPTHTPHYTIPSELFGLASEEDMSSGREDAPSLDGRAAGPAGRPAGPDERPAGPNERATEPGKLLRQSTTLQPTPRLGCKRVNYAGSAAVYPEGCIHPLNVTSTPHGYLSSPSPNGRATLTHEHATKPTPFKQNEHRAPHSLAHDPKDGGADAPHGHCRC